MAEDSPSHKGLYITLGALAAVGAGYLAWRYLLSDDQKDAAKSAVHRVTMKARSVGRQLAEENPLSR
jgi:hypothetical protein